MIFTSPKVFRGRKFRGFCSLQHVVLGRVYLLFVVISVALVLFIFDDFFLFFLGTLVAFCLLLSIQFSQLFESLYSSDIRLCFDNVLIQCIEFVYVERFFVL